MIKEDTIININDNNLNQKVTAEQAAEIFNKREELSGSPSAYMADYDAFKNEEENINLQIKNNLDYAGTAKSLADNNLFSVYKSHIKELKKKEDILSRKEYEGSGIWNKLSTSYKASSLSMDKSYLYNDLAEARNAGNVSKAAKLSRKIGEINDELSRLPKGTGSGVSGALGSLGASFVEFAPEAIGSALLGVGASLAAPSTGGATAPLALVGKAKTLGAIAKIVKYAQPIVQSALVYNKSANIEQGSIYEELDKKYPNMSEATKQQIARIGGQYSGAVEALGSSMGFGLMAKKFLYPAIAKKLATGTSPKMLASQTFKKSLLEKIADIELSAAVAGAGEGAEEVVQNEINTAIDELIAQNEGVDYTNVLGETLEGIGGTVANIANVKATDEDFQKMQTFLNVAVASGIFSSGIGGVGLAINSAGDFSAPKGKKPTMFDQLAKGEQNLATAENYMQHKTDSKVNQLSQDAYKENTKTLVQEGVAPEFVFLDVDTALALLQDANSNDVLAEKVARMNLEEKIKEAENGNGKVAIDFELADENIFDTEDTTLFQKIKGDISFDEESMSKNEADAYIKEVIRQMPKIQEELENTESITNQVIKQLKGNMEGGEAVANATLARLVISSIAEATGKDEAEMIKELGLKIDVEKRKTKAGVTAKAMKEKKHLLGKNTIKGVKVKKQKVDLKNIEPNDILTGEGVEYLAEEGDNVILYEDKDGKQTVVKGDDAVASAHFSEGETKANVTVVSEKDGYTIDDAKKMVSEIDEDVNANTKDEKLYQIIKEGSDLADENARLDDMYPEYKGETIDINGEERTVYNSNGDRIAKSAEALRNFYNWFGDSKVVDEQGRPMVVYHGSDKIFDTFDNSKSDKIRQIGADKGYFFTTSEKVARRFIPKKEQNRDENKIIKKEFGSVRDYNEFKNKLYKDANSLKKELGDDVFFEKRNKFFEVQNKLSEPYDAQEYGLYSVYLKAENAREISGEVIGTGVDREFFMESSRQTGYDGIIIRDADTGAGIADEFIVFDSNQIKSTDNRGTYSTEEDNIYLQAPESTIAGYYDPKQVLIRLTKASNPTTFAHELMHFHFDMMSRAYENGELTEYWGKQFEKLLKNMGAKIVDGKITFESNEARIAANEKLAEQFTTYLSEGKAPTKGLEALFDMFRDMFMRAYRMIRGLKQVRLSKTVTDYFDNILIKEDEATALATEERYGAISRPAGVSDSDWNNYIALTKRAHSQTVSGAITKTAKIVEKQSTEAYKEKYEGFYKEFLEMLNEDEQFLARRDAGKFKIDPDSLKNKLTGDRKLSPSWLKKGGMDAEVFVRQGNFKSIDELVDFINSNPSIEQRASEMAREQADLWLKEEFPELQSADVEASSRNIATIKAQILEAMMLRGIPTEQFGLYYTNLVKTAENAFNQMKLSKAKNVESFKTQLNILTERYRIAERNGDVNEMGKLRYRAAVTNYYLMRAYALQKMEKNFTRHFGKYKKLTPTQQQLKHIEGSVWDIIHSAMYNFGITGRKPAVPTSVSERISDYLTDKQDTYLANDLILETSAFLNNDAKTEYKDLSAEDFATLDGALRLLENVSRAMREGEVAEGRMTIQEAVDKTVEKLDEKGAQKWDDQKTIRNFVLGQTAMKETLLSRVLPKKVFNQYVLPFMESLVKKSQWISEKGNKLAKIIEPIMKRKDDVYSIDGRTFTLENLLVIMLNSGNAHNRKCMVKTLAYKDESFDDARLQSILNQSPKELRAVAQQVWNFFEENSKDFREAQQSIMGAELKMVEPSPVTFDDGTVLTGGYYPAGKKPVAVGRDFNESSVMHMGDAFPIFSFQKERTKIAHGDLELSLRPLEAWLYRMASMINVAKPYMNLYSLISNKDFRERFGDAGISALQNWMHQSIQPDAVSKGLAFLDSMSSVAVLGWRPIKAIVQLSGILPAMKEVGVVRVMSELLPIAINPMNWFTIMNKARSLSNYMNDRFSNPENHLADVRRMSFLTGGKAKKGLEFANNFGMLFVAYGDCIASYATWNAQFKKALEKGATESQARLEADSTVRRLQGDTSAGSRPPLLQGDKRFITKFASYFIGINSMISSDWVYGNKRNAVAMLMVAGVMAPIFEAYMSYTLEWLGADDDKKKRWAREDIHSAEDLLNRKLVENISSSTASSLLPAYGIGSLISQAIVSNKTYPSEVTALTYIDNLLNIKINTQKAYTAESDSDKEKFQKKAIKNVLQTAGVNVSGLEETKNIINNLLRRQ